jgi:hypothetical protein
MCLAGLWLITLLLLLLPPLVAPPLPPGARLLQLLFQRYTLVLGWALVPYPAPGVTPVNTSVDQADSARASKAAVHGAVLQLLMSLTGQLQAQVAAARQDLGAVARQGFVHGVLLGLRYIVELVPWSEMSVVNNGQLPGQTCGQSSAEGDQAVAVQLQQWVGQLVVLLLEVVELAGPQLSQQDLNVAAGEVDEDLADLDEDLDEDLADLHADVGDTAEGAAADGSTGAVNSAGLTAKSTVLGPAVQLLITCSWTSVKEVALLAGTLARCLPLPGEGGATSAAAAAVQPPPSSSTGDLGQPSSTTGAVGGGDPTHAVAPPAATAAGAAGGGVVAMSSPGRLPLLSPVQLASLGEALLDLLLAMKHNGAVDKTQLGYVALCGRLLGSGCPQLAALPGGHGYRWVRG